jgi:predicted lipoprotein with Yx(FWY)xxD motif
LFGDDEARPRSRKDAARRLVLLTLSIGMVVVGMTGCAGPQTTPGSAASPLPVNTTTASPSPVRVSAPLVSPSGQASTSATPHVQVTPTQIELAVASATVDGKQADVVTVNGWTAYRFEKDGSNPPQATCYHACAEMWPPAVTDGTSIKVSGINRSLVGTVVRKDGYVQVTLGGWPLYRFKGDKARGQTKGHGVAGDWSTIRPNAVAVNR